MAKHLRLGSSYKLHYCPTPSRADAPIRQMAVRYKASRNRDWHHGGHDAEKLRLLRRRYGRLPWTLENALAGTCKSLGRQNSRPPKPALTMFTYALSAEAAIKALDKISLWKVQSESSWLVFHMQSSYRIHHIH